MLVNGKRAMATIQVIKSITPIEGADRIELAHVLGWQSVVQKGQFFPGQKVVYLEIDSWVPSVLAPFLDTTGTKEYGGVRGNKLRTVKLRGTLSQGLILKNEVVANHGVGDDVTEELGVQKWEPAVDAGTSGVIGSWDYRIPKTDQERCQSLDPEFWASGLGEHGHTFEVTEKCDGQSITFFLDETAKNIRLFSRNNEIAISDSMEELLQPFLAYFPTHANHAFQCELIGPKIQGNPYKLNNLHLLVYDIFDMDRNLYIMPSTVRALCRTWDLPHVPVIGRYNVRPSSSEEALNRAEGFSRVGSAKVEREGLVWKQNTENRLSFKAVSNKYLLKHN